jgi:ParB family chromosome partitioning protein
VPNNRRGLGRGLDSLIPTELADSGEFDPINKVSQKADVVEQVNPANITPNPDQPRQYFDEAGINQLAQSIKNHGIVQPLVVSATDAGYQLIAGERRLRAAKKAGLKQVPVIIRTLDDQTRLEVALIENVQRAALNPVETAMAYKKLVDQFNLRLEDVASRVGKDLSTISNTIRLLGLPLEAKRALVEGKITEGHARAILSVSAKDQSELLKLILTKTLSVRQTEALARGFKSHGDDKKAVLRQLEVGNQWTKQLSQQLSTRVSISRSAKGNKLVIEYGSDEDLEKIARRILGS